MDPFLPAMVLTSLCLAATKVYRHLRPNDQQPALVQTERHDGDSETADSTSKDPTCSEEASDASTVSKESPVSTCDEKESEDTSGKSRKLVFVSIILSHVLL